MSLELARLVGGFNPSHRASSRQLATLLSGAVVHKGGNVLNIPQVGLGSACLLQVLVPQARQHNVVD